MVVKPIASGVLLLAILFTATITVAGYVGRASDTTIMSAIITPLRRPGFSVETIYRLFDLDRTVSLHGRLEDASEVRLSPDGRKALVLDGKAFGGEYRYAFYLYDLTTGKRWLLYEQDVTAGLLSNHSWQSQAWSADGTRLAYLHPYEQRVYVFDLTNETRRPLLDVEIDDAVRFISWSPDGRQIAVGTYKEVLLVLPSPTTFPVVHVPLDYGGRIVWSPDSRYLVVQNVSTTQIWFDVFEAHTERFVMPEITIPGNFVGWSCNSNRIVYTQWLSETTSENSSGTVGIFVLNIAKNSQSHIELESEIDSMEVYFEYCDYYLLLVTTVGSSSRKFMGLDLSTVNPATVSPTPFHDQAQLVEQYPDGSLVYRVEDRAANGVPLWHYFRYHGGISQALFSSSDPALLVGWWEYRWFENNVPSETMRVLAIDSRNTGPSPFGRLAIVNIVNQSRYYLTTADEIATQYIVWR